MRCRGEGPRATGKDLISPEWKGSLRTPCLIRWPGHVAPGRVSNEIVHITDMFTTLITLGRPARSPLIG